MLHRLLSKEAPFEKMMDINEECSALSRIPFCIDENTDMDEFVRSNDS